MDPTDTAKQNRRGFLQSAGGVATLTMGLPSAGAAKEATGVMKIEHVGVMSPGDMGQAVASQIKAKGLNVYTALERRSERSRALAREAGLTDVGSLAQLVERCDVVLSVMDPGAAVSFAREISEAIRAAGRHTLVVDCNAIAPDTVREIAGLVQQAGGRFLDGGIIGPPPRGKAKTNLYVSGPGAADLEQLAGPQLIVRVIGEGIADASPLKEHCPWNRATPRNRTGFLQSAGGAAATLTMGLPSAGAAKEATGAMKIEHVGVMSPGDMGQAVASQIKAKGLSVYTALERRSERTRALAREAGLIDVVSLAQLVERCDVVLSVMDPGSAVSFAREISEAIRAAGRHTLVVDGNAIAPDTVREIAGLVQQAGGRFLDGGIIGPPPRGKAKNNLYGSGTGAARLEQLPGPQLIVRVIGEGIADASALKEHFPWNRATPRNRTGFLQSAGGAAATLTMGLPSAGAAKEDTGALKSEHVGVMSPGDMGQAVASQIKAKGLSVYTALERRSERTRALAREAGLIDEIGRASCRE